MERIGSCPNCGHPLYLKDKYNDTQLYPRKPEILVNYYKCQNCEQIICQTEVRK